jgi:hypothetical protein
LNRKCDEQALDFWVYFHKKTVKGGCQKIVHRENAAWVLPKCMAILVGKLMIRIWGKMGTGQNWKAVPKKTW